MQCIQFRPMTAEDVNAVMEIELSVYEFPWTKGIFADCIRVGYDCWIAQQDDQVIGYGVLSAAAGESHVLNIAVSKSFQRQGIGRQFLSHLIDRAQLLSAEMILLEVRPSNRSAIHLYESMGFNEIGSRKAYYPSHKGKEDALLYARQL